MLVISEEYNHYKYISRGIIDIIDTNDQKVNLIINKKLLENKNES